MITEYIRYRLASDASDAAEEFEAACRLAARVLEASPHCVDYELARCHEEPYRYVLRIRWDSLDGHLDGFRADPGFAEFRAHVAAYLDAVEEIEHYIPTSIAGPDGAQPQPPSLFEWAGGYEAIETLFIRFYDLVLADDLLRPLFEHMDPQHPRHVAIWIGEVFGGPADYSAHHGGHPEMLRHHLDKAITEEQRRRWISLLVDAADQVGLPDDPEFRAAFMGYVEWGTRLAKLFSQPGAQPNMNEPVPRWQWALPPWQN